MQHRFYVVLALKSRPDLEQHPMTLYWDADKSVHLGRKLGPVPGFDGTLYEVVGVFAGKDRMDDYRVFLECLHDGGGRIVVDSHDYGHYRPEWYVFGQEAGSWVCHEIWSENQSQHELLEEKEIHCGMTALKVLSEILLPQTFGQKESSRFDQPIRLVA